MDGKNPINPIFLNLILEELIDLSRVLRNATWRGVKLLFQLMILTWVLSFFLNADLGFLITIVFVIDVMRIPITRELPKKIWKIVSRDDPPKIDPVIEFLKITIITLKALLALLLFMAVGHYGHVRALLGHLPFLRALFTFFAGLGGSAVVLSPDDKMALVQALVPALVRVLCLAWDAIHGLVFRLTTRESLSGSMAYDYQSLRVEESEIRLIQITKSRPFSRPRYSLVITPLATAPPYDAVSYTWDGQEYKYPVAFDGKNLLTTLNAKKILQQRGSHLRTVHLWVDAICINQKDRDEKSSQIALVGKIYSQARRTLIWLENDKPTPSEAIRIELVFFVINTIAKYFSEDKLVLDSVCLQLLAPGKCLSLERFLKHRYWSRGWIIPEIARGRQVHILYGNQLLDWEHVHRALWLKTQPPLHKHIVKNTIVVNILQKISARKSETNMASRFLSLHYIRQVRLYKSITLRAALEWTSGANVSILHDKVFLLRSLVLKDSDPDSQLAHVLRVDYESGLSVIFTRLAKYLLFEDPEYLFREAGVGWLRDITTLESRHCDIITLPSWVPDWRFKPNVMASEDVPYRAGGDGKFEVETLKGDLLRLPIVKVAALDIFTRPFKSTPEDDNGIITSFYRSAVQVVESLPETWSPATGQSRHESFWRTIIGNLVRRTPTSQLMYPAPAEWGELYQRWIRSPMGPEGDFRFIVKPLTDDDHFDMNFIVACHRRCFAITDSGHMALVPELASTGDIVCVSPGLQWPLLLRKKENDESLELVGNCYVHGLMDGEGLKQGKEVKAYLVG